MNVVKDNQPQSTFPYFQSNGITTTLYRGFNGELKATKYGRHVWYLKSELETFLTKKTEQ